MLRFRILASWRKVSLSGESGEAAERGFVFACSLSIQLFYLAQQHPVKSLGDWGHCRRVLVAAKN